MLMLFGRLYHPSAEGGSGPGEDVSISNDELTEANASEAEFEAAMSQAASGADDSETEQAEASAAKAASAEAEDSGDAEDSEVESEEDAEQTPTEGSETEEAANAGTPSKDNLSDVTDLSVSSPPVEAVEQAQVKYEQDIRAAEQQAQQSISVPLNTLRTTIVDSQSKLKAIEDALKDETHPNGERPPTLSEVREIQYLENMIRVCEGGIDQLKSKAQATVATAAQKALIEANKNVDPRLRQYAAEYEEAVNEGVSFKSFDHAVLYCRSLRESRGGKAAAVVKPEVVKQKTLEADLKRKAQGRISAGSKTSTLVKSAKSQNPYLDSDTQMPANVRSYLESVFTNG